MAVKLGNKSLGVLKVLLIYTAVWCGTTWQHSWKLFRYKLYRFCDNFRAFQR